MCVCVTLSSKYTLCSAGSESWYVSAEQAKSDKADLRLSPHLRLQTSKEMFEPVKCESIIMFLWGRGKRELIKHSKSNLSPQQQTCALPSKHTSMGMSCLVLSVVLRPFIVVVL